MFSLGRMHSRLKKSWLFYTLSCSIVSSSVCWVTIGPCNGLRHQDIMWINAGLLSNGHATVKFYWKLYLRKPENALGKIFLFYFRPQWVNPSWLIPTRSSYRADIGQVTWSPRPPPARVHTCHPPRGDVKQTLVGRQVTPMWVFVANQDFL